MLFNYMQIWLAAISKEGWEFLIQQYGYEKLFEINIKSDWIDCEELDEFIKEAQSPVFPRLKRSRCRSSQEVNDSPTPFSALNYC